MRLIAFVFLVILAMFGLISARVGSGPMGFYDYKDGYRNDQYDPNYLNPTSNGGDTHYHDYDRNIPR